MALRLRCWSVTLRAWSDDRGSRNPIALGCQCSRRSIAIARPGDQDGCKWPTRHEATALGTVAARRSRESPDRRREPSGARSKNRNRSRHTKSRKADTASLAVLHGPPPSTRSRSRCSRTAPSSTRTRHSALSPERGPSLSRCSDEQTACLAPSSNKPLPTSRWRALSVPESVATSHSQLRWPSTTSSVHILPSRRRCWMDNFPSLGKPTSECRRSKLIVSEREAQAISGALAERVFESTNRPVCPRHDVGPHRIVEKSWQLSICRPARAVTVSSTPQRRLCLLMLIERDVLETGG